MARNFGAQMRRSLPAFTEISNLSDGIPIVKLEKICVNIVSISTANLAVPAATRSILTYVV